MYIDNELNKLGNLIWTNKQNKRNNIDQLLLFKPTTDLSTYLFHHEQIISQI